MKTAVYIDDDRTQIALTPENEFEKDVLNKVYDNRLDAAICSGRFYDCQGGFTRRSSDCNQITDYSEKSLMILIDGAK